MTVDIPEDPHAFFTELLPHQYAASLIFPRTPSAAPAAFEVFDHGAWSLAVRDRRLEVVPGVLVGTALRVGTWREDFDSLFVHRTRREVSRLGDVPDELRRVFLPLFLNERRRRIAGLLDGRLRLELREGSATYRLVITTGTGDPPQKATVRMSLAHFFAMAAGEVSMAKLLLRGALRVEGSKAHALQISQLLG